MEPMEHMIKIVMTQCLVTFQFEDATTLVIWCHLVFWGGVIQKRNPGSNFPRFQ